MAKRRIPGLAWLLLQVCGGVLPLVAWVKWYCFDAWFVIRAMPQTQEKDLVNDDVKVAGQQA